MDRKAFELGYLMGRAISRIRAIEVAAATRGLEASLAHIVSIDRMFTELLETLDLDEWEIWPLERPWWRFSSYKRVWMVLEYLPRSAEEAYETGIQHARKIAESMDQSGLHDVIQHLLESTPKGYGEERESLPPDVRWLADMLGMSPDEALNLIGGKLLPEEALRTLQEIGGSRGVFARFFGTPNPFATFRRKLLYLWRQLNSQKVRALWPKREGWGAALGGAILVGADIVKAVEGIAGLPSVGKVAGAIQAVYSVPEGLARIQRGIAVIRSQVRKENEGSAKGS